MAGPNLELFKFGLYLFFPLAVMVHYGDPEWYHRHVLPIRDQFWPKEESLYKPPRNAEDVKAALEEFKAKRLARREARLEQERLQQSQVTASPSAAASQSQKQPSSIPTKASSDSEPSLVQRLKTESAFTRADTSKTTFDTTDRQRMV